MLITNLCYERCLEVSIREIDPAGLRHSCLLVVVLLLCIRRDSLLAPCSTDFFYSGSVYMTSISVQLYESYVYRYD
eukprot:COSAG01_NODE_47305_length_391_cov_3.678082_2_plen_75_part_01